MSWRLIATLATLINLFAAFTAAQAATRTGYILIDANSGQQLAAKNSNTPFMPASTMKLVTMLSALDHLGPDHRFETSLYYTGKIKDTTLEGDLVKSRSTLPVSKIQTVWMRLHGIETMNDFLETKPIYYEVE